MRGDETVIEIIKYFFGDELSADELNDPLRELAAEVLHKALKMTKLLDMVPRPMGAKPGLSWIAEHAVETVWRRHQQDKIYKIAKDTLRWQYRTQYQMAKMGI